MQLARVQARTTRRAGSAWNGDTGKPGTRATDRLALSTARNTGDEPPGEFAEMRQLPGLPGGLMGGLPPAGTPAGGPPRP